MTNRSAHATIKGYFYQFDHTALQILSASTLTSVIAVEGIEDVDLETAGETTLTQCKYYEGTEYNHSVIKDAVIHMLRHFKEKGGMNTPPFRYRIYGHFSGGQDKLSADFDIEFLKKHFLTFTHKKVTYEMHVELSTSDAELKSFLQLLKIDINAKSYDDQQDQVISLLKSTIPGCLDEDAKAFYYPNAINAIQSLAIQADVGDRTTTKSRFLKEVNRKELVFSAWLRQKFGDEHYARAIKRKHFHFPLSTKVPKSVRIFAMDAQSEFDLANLTQLLIKIGKRFSHVENVRTTPTDRFCPYVHLAGISTEELVALKESLLAHGVEISDGHAFDGAQFSAARLARPPSKDHPVRLKFIGLPAQIAQVVAAESGVTVEVFDFFKVSALAPENIPHHVPHHKLKTDTVYFINGAI